MRESESQLIPLLHLWYALWAAVGANVLETKHRDGDGGYLESHSESIRRVESPLLFWGAAI